MLSTSLSFSSTTSFSTCRPPFRITASATTVRTMSTTTAPSLYDVLGLSAGAKSNEIKAAYRRLARACHPDVRKASASADEFMRIHEAYSTLSDPSKRADYDRGRLAVVGRERWSAAPRAQSFPGHGRRTWETDQCW